MNIKLTGCQVSAIRADPLKNNVKVTFDAHLDDELMEAKRLLAILAVDESPVDLLVTEQQMRLPLKGGGELTGASTETHAEEPPAKTIDAGEVLDEVAAELNKQEGIEAQVSHAMARNEAPPSGEEALPF